MREDLKTVVRYIEKRDNVTYIDSKVGFISARCHNCRYEKTCEDISTLPCILYRYKEE